ncbi:Starch-binding associating with outer membrane [Fodinibius roseus]|uniref:Starch-binding associating with outer membrane n=1 Tax=Fodinibius roseus TaxID=1194090 RepID=A0A1M4SZ40_9BACT|nr:RagB/SusD family nutrient uptake outer membrane protein [Fodinibius roseus]SHE37472.1 Starch-binding associating with outer membrane [Fodinibius roseus]
MKKLTDIFLLMIIVLLAASCDVLNEEVVSDITAQTHFTTPGGFEDAVNAAYEPLRSFYGTEQGGNITEYGTDLIRNAGHGGYHYMNQYNAGLNSEGDPMANLWDNYYVGINSCNAVINRAPEVEGMDEDTQKTRVGEAHFLRAHYYFHLVEHFGPVHLTTEETKEVETEATRAPESDVYEQIISDLETAIANLPGSQEDYGRATEPAAKMLLSQVLLTRGYKDYGTGSDFSEAARLAEEVIDDYSFELLDDFEMIFDNDNEQNAEIIWAVQYGQDPLLNGNGNGSHLYYRPWYETYSYQGKGGIIRTNEPGYGRPWIRFKPTSFALENYRPLDQDARYDQSFQDIWYYNDSGNVPEYPGARNPSPSAGDTAIYIDPDMTQAEVEQEQPNTSYNLISWSTIPINMFPSLKKHDDFQRPSVNEPAGNKDYIVYRLAEAYLFAAEAYLMDGNPGAAVPHLNEVRRRAAWPGQESSMEITTGDVDLEFILDERGREFYGEQKRWLTLKRTGTLLERVRDYNDNEEAQANIEDYHMLRPIPATQLNRTTNDYEQNPGY